MAAVVTRLSAIRQARQVSDAAEFDFTELRAAIDELPEMNATKLVSLHLRIVNGDYKIDSQRLAEKLIDLESCLD